MPSESLATIAGDPGKRRTFDSAQMSQIDLGARFGEHLNETICVTCDRPWGFGEHSAIRIR